LATSWTWPSPDTSQVTSWWHYRSRHNVTRS